MIDFEPLYAEEICLLADLACRAKEKGMEDIYTLIYQRLQLENEIVHEVLTQKLREVNIEH